MQDSVIRWFIWRGRCSGAFMMGERNKLNPPAQANWRTFCAPCDPLCRRTPRFRPQAQSVLGIPIRQDHQSRNASSQIYSCCGPHLFQRGIQTRQIKGVEVHERVAREFVEQILERQPGEVLTLANAYLYFCEYLRGRGMVPVKRSILKGMFAPLIRDAFNLGLRNDVIDQATNHQTAGWKGLRALEVQEMAEKGSNS